MNPIVILLLTLGGALLFEGIVWSLAPGAARRAYAQMMEQLDDRALSNIGLITLVVGAVMVLAAVMMGR